jgi:hypothetical protein
MAKFVKKCPTLYQLCTLYKKTNIEKEEQLIDAKDEDILGDVADI